MQYPPAYSIMVVIMVHVMNYVVYGVQPNMALPLPIIVDFVILPIILVEQTRKSVKAIPSAA